jgi:hypothetical protein
MTVSKFVALLAWSSWFAMAWLGVLGKIDWSIQTITTHVLFFVIAIASGLSIISDVRRNVKDR